MDLIRPISSSLNSDLRSVYPLEPRQVVNCGEKAGTDTGAETGRLNLFGNRFMVLEIHRLWHRMIYNSIERCLYKIPTIYNEGVCFSRHNHDITLYLCLFQHDYFSHNHVSRNTSTQTILCSIGIFYIHSTHFSRISLVDVDRRTCGRPKEELVLRETLRNEKSD